jgi:predicted flavoprotein YhiN
MARETVDAVIVGAGAAGLMCAIEAGRRGRRVVVLEHNPQIARKILISGGGRCNFTNLNVTAENFVSRNPHFAKSALARFTPRDFLAMVERHRIPYHEKTLGQLFCDRAARDIVAMLEAECAAAGVRILTACMVPRVGRTHGGGFEVETSGVDETSGSATPPAGGGLEVARSGGGETSGGGLEVSASGGATPPASGGFEVETSGGGETSGGARLPAGGGFEVAASGGAFQCAALVISTGGLSIPKMGATPFGYSVARQFGLHIVECHPALVPFTFGGTDRERFAGLAGVSADVAAKVTAEVTAEVKAGVTPRASGRAFRDKLLFTHRGLSGPAILQASSYWRAGESVEIDLLPGVDFAAVLAACRAAGARTEVRTVLARYLPKRLADRWCQVQGVSKSVVALSDREVAAIAADLRAWRVQPAGTEGYDKAEVTGGGVDTAELSSKTMECRNVPGLYFIGEVVDVTGQLGGFNFQWAWASGAAAGRAL